MRRYLDIYPRSRRHKPLGNSFRTDCYVWATDRKAIRSLDGFLLANDSGDDVTGLFFLFHGFTPAIGVGLISLVLLDVAISSEPGVCALIHNRAADNHYAIVNTSKKEL